MSKYLYFLSFFLFIGCQQSSYDDNNLELVRINIDPTNYKPLKLSEIYRDAKFIKLETLEDHLIPRIKKMIIENDQLFLLCSNSIMIFDRNGNFISEINNPGSGPGEYKSLRDIQINSQNKVVEILDSKSRKIIRYDTNGKFIDEWHNRNITGYSFLKLNDDVYSFYSGNLHFGDFKYKLHNISKANEKVLGKFFIIDPIEANYMHFFDKTNYEMLNGNFFFLYSYNDTIYNISEKNISPRIVIDFGKYSLPKSVFTEKFNNVVEFTMHCEKTNYAYHIDGYLETDNHIFFTYKYKKKRYHVYYSKLSQELKITNILIDDLVLQGFKSPTSYSTMPVGRSENEHYTIVEPFEFLAGMDSLKMSLNAENWNMFITRNPDLHKMYETTNIEDNPIIAIWELK